LARILTCSLTATATANSCRAHWHMSDFQVNLPGAFRQECSCGRVFAQPGAFKNHQNSCLSSKKVLTDILARTRDVLASRKAKKAINLKAQASGSTGSSDAHNAGLACAEDHEVRNLPESCYTIRFNQELGGWWHVSSSIGSKCFNVHLNCRSFRSPLQKAEQTSKDPASISSS
jgi:hypothetical protein